jgi:hypothetical protein
MLEKGRYADMLKADFCARPIFGSDVGSAHLGHIHKLN